MEALRFVSANEEKNLICRLENRKRPASRLAIFWVGLVCSLLFPLGGYAQVLYGTLTGTVTDASGALVSGAHVTALNTQTGVSSEAKTGASGIYRIASLQPGTYKVTIGNQGFSTQETPSLVVNANEIARLDAQLKVGTATQEVNVSTQAALLQTDKADVHTELSAQQIEDLPTMGTEGRNFQGL